MRNYAELQQTLSADLDLGHWKDGPIASDMAVSTVARRSLHSSLLKKLAPDGDTAVADAAALEKFRAVNSSLPVDPFVFKSECEAESVWYDYFKDELNQLLGPLNPGSVITADGNDVSAFDISCIRNGMGIGPGSNQGASDVDFVSKLFVSKLTTTNDDLIRWYRGALTETGYWEQAERLRFHEFGFRQVYGGNVFFAPKNAEISRTCCTEPTLNMLIQKAIGWFIEQRLKYVFGITLKSMPDVNRWLAYLGSIDGSIATIDQTSASDSTGLQMLRATLERSFLKTAIESSRCSHVVLPGGERVELRMVSTMGNGFTFQLLSAIGICAVKAVYTLMGIVPRAGTNFGVFGDDICCLTKAAPFLMKMLEKLGYSVNHDKSFIVGPFRESCGHDYFKGHQVRGVYCKSAETSQEIFSLINRLNRWGAHHSVPLTRTIKLLRSWLPKKVHLVPLSESDDAGLKVPFDMTRPKLDNRYWFKYRLHVKRGRVNVFTCEETVDCQDDAVVIVPDVALALAGIGGYVEAERRPADAYSPCNPVMGPPTKFLPPFNKALGRRVSVRERESTGLVQYKVLSSSTPFWDYVPIGNIVERFTTADEVVHGKLSGPMYRWNAIHDESGYRVTPVNHVSWVEYVRAGRDYLTERA